MAGKAMDIGVVGRRVAANIEATRRKQRMPLTHLSASMGEAGRPIPPTGLARIESCERRVDVEDLVVIASCLGTSALELLQLTDAEKAETAEGRPPLAFGTVSTADVDYESRVGADANATDGLADDETPWQGGDLEVEGLEVQLSPEVKRAIHEAVEMTLSHARIVPQAIHGITESNSNVAPPAPRTESERP